MLSLLKLIFIVGSLTLLTQVGGIFYLIYLSFKPFIQKKVKGFLQWIARIFVFAIVYLILSLFILPPIAAYFGRVPLPLAILDESPLIPRSYLFCLSNRHYVKPELKQLLLDQSEKLATEYPGVKLMYLDASFPFYDGYPLLPHLSHDDGQKADIAFFYRHLDESLANRTPAWIGYGFYEGPQEGEIDQPTICAEKGEWQYSIIGQYSPTTDADQLIFDAAITSQFLKQLAQDDRTGKILLEPHLKTRLGLSELSKIRYHGCQAVRHDDHLHVEL